jgi:hypothetical protein
MMASRRQFISLLGAAAANAALLRLLEAATGKRVWWMPDGDAPAKPSARE